MKKMNLLLVSVLAVSLLSAGVLAQVPTPGDALRDLSSFFGGLFTGGASMDEAYFISFVLYFILFLAVFLEGLRVVPVFGSSGELNKQGKVFGVAAAALATIAIFAVEQTTGNRIEWLVAPFGIWGGLVLAGIIALITFKMIKDSELFKEQIMMAMAIAGAVGITFAGFLLGLENLLGWGFLIMLLVFVVGAVRAFSLHWGETAEERKARKKEMVQKEVERFKKADEERKKKKEQERKEKKLKPVKGFLVNCVNAAEEGIVYLREGNKKEAKAEAEKFNKNVRIAWRELKKRRNEAKGEERDKLEQLVAGVQLMVNEINDEVLKKIKAADWRAKASEVITALSSFRNRCGAIIKEIDKLMG